MALLTLNACRSLPTAGELLDSTAAVPGGATTVADDARARFREIFCSRVMQSSGDPQSGCDALIWRLPDESPIATAGELPFSIRKDLRVFVVSGAFGDCRVEHMFPYESAIDRLVALGYRIEKVKVSGRSSAETNARRLAAVIRAAEIGPAEKVVLIGYSKGAVDSLQLLGSDGDVAAKVAAVVSVAGPILGSPLAERTDWWYRKVFVHWLDGLCDPGDGGVITSLLPATREQWLAAHPLPTNVHYYSLAAFTTGEHLSRALIPPWRILAEIDPRNDGQVIVGDAYIPGSTLLGYANADHWDIAIDIDKQLPWLSSRSSPRRFPREALFESILMYVSETLETDATAPH